MSQIFTLSLKLAPSGRDTFMQGLTFSFCSTATIAFTRSLLQGGVSKGPATKPAFTQLATLSVIYLPCLQADFAFFTVTQGREFF
jgi:hypothetical protein